MPSGIVFHEGNALALDRLGQDHSGLALHGLGLCECSLNGFEIMAVDLDDVGTKGGELLIQRLGGHNIAGAAVDLQAVDVHDGAEVIELILGSGHEGFPNLTFGHFAVAQDGIDAVILVLYLTGQSHADSNGDALTQRTGGHIDTVDMLHFHVTGHMAINAAEHLEFFDREEATQRENGIDSGRAMTLGHDEAVTVGVLGILRIHIHFVKIQSRQHVHAGHGAARMAGGCVIDHGNAQKSGFGSGQSQLLVGKLFHNILLSYDFSGYPRGCTHLSYTENPGMSSTIHRKAMIVCVGFS